MQFSGGLGEVTPAEFAQFKPLIAARATSHQETQPSGEKTSARTREAGALSQTIAGTTRTVAHADQSVT